MQVELNENGFKQVHNMVRAMLRRTYGLDTESIAQEIILEKWQKQPKQPQQNGPLMIEVEWTHVHNRCVDAIRANKASHLVFVELEKLDWADPRVESDLNLSVDTDENERDIHALIEAIMPIFTPRQRELIFLKFYLGLRNVEIAERLGISRQAVTDAIKRAIERVQEVAQREAERIQRELAKPRELAEPAESNTETSI